MWIYELTIEEQKIIHNLLIDKSLEKDNHGRYVYVSGDESFKLLKLIEKMGKCIEVEQSKR